MLKTSDLSSAAISRGGSFLLLISPLVGYVYSDLSYWDSWCLSIIIPEIY